METFLFNWRAGNGWGNFEQVFEQYLSEGFVEDDWTCGRRTHLPVGSRFFLIRLGKTPKGIVAAGRTLTKPRRKRHWNRKKGKFAIYVDVKFTEIVRPEEDCVLPLAILQKKFPTPNNWTPQGGGVLISDKHAEKLEQL